MTDTIETTFLPQREQDLRQIDPADIAIRSSDPETGVHDTFRIPEEEKPKEDKPGKKGENDFQLSPFSVMAKDRSFIRKQAEALKSTGRTALAHTFEGVANFYNVLDGVADKVADLTGTEKGGIFKKMTDAQIAWATYYRDKITYEDYMTKVVGGLLGSGPGVMQFSLGVPMGSP